MPSISAITKAENIRKVCQETRNVCLITERYKNTQELFTLKPVTPTCLKQVEGFQKKNGENCITKPLLAVKTS